MGKHNRRRCRAWCTGKFAKRVIGRRPTRQVQQRPLRMVASGVTNALLSFMSVCAVMEIIKNYKKLAMPAFNSYVMCVIRGSKRYYMRADMGKQTTM
jgi:hypothetical protein